MQNHACFLSSVVARLTGRVKASESKTSLVPIQSDCMLDTNLHRAINSSSHVHIRHCLVICIFCCIVWACSPAGANSVPSGLGAEWAAEDTRAVNETMPLIGGGARATPGGRRPRVRTTTGGDGGGMPVPPESSDTTSNPMQYVVPTYFARE
jgi:hypothetical protein